MENKRDYTAAWQFFGTGCLVAFLAMVIVCYNQSATISEKNHMLSADRVIHAYDVQINQQLSSENDSLYKSNDSLWRANKILKLNLPQETNIRNVGTLNIGN